MPANTIPRSAPADSRRSLPFTLLLLFLAGLLAFRVLLCLSDWNTAYGVQPLKKLAVDAITIAVPLLLFFFLDQAWLIRFSPTLTLIVLLFLLLGAIFKDNIYYGWVSVFALRIHLPALLCLLILPLSSFTARRSRISTGYGLFLIAALGLIPAALALLHYVMDYVAVYAYSCVVFVFYVRREGRLEMPRPAFTVCAVVIPLLLLALTCAPYLHFADIILSRGAADPNGLGFRLQAMDSCWEGVRFLGASPQTLAKLPELERLAGSTAYAPFGLLLMGGWLAFAGMLACTAGLIACLYRLPRQMTNAFARYFSFLVPTFFLFRVIWNLITCFFGFDAELNLPFFASSYSILVLDTLLLAADLRLYLQRMEPLPAYIFPNEEPEAPAAEAEADRGFFSLPILRNLSRIITPIPAADLPEETAPGQAQAAAQAYAEWQRLLEQAGQDPDFPQDTAAAIYPVCLLEGTLYLFCAADGQEAQTLLRSLQEHSPHRLRLLVKNDIAS